ncbi:MFS multidrug transporter-like protein, partial [Aureobasidium melanogenum]
MEDDHETRLQPIRTGRSARQFLSRTRSNKSNNSSKSRPRSNSRPSRPSSPLERLTSANFIDDHGVYHHHADSDYEQEGVEEEESQHDGSHGLSQQSSSDLDTNKEKRASDEPDEVFLEPFGAETALDVEAQSEKDAPRLSRKSTSKSVKDPNLVTWDGPDDPENPKNWGKGRKWAATLVVSSFTFISPVSSSMVAPAIGAISRDFNITSTAEQELVLS